MSDPTKTAYGAISPRAPTQLRAFSFLIGKWAGEGRTRLPDGTAATFPVTWISLRQYDAGRRTRIVEYRNVPGSFLRRQVNAAAGAVEVNGRDVMVASGSPGVSIREHYIVADSDNFTYRLDVSNDGGNWHQGQIEMMLHRVE